MKKLSESQIVEKLKAQFAGVALDWVQAEAATADSYLMVPADQVLALATFLKSDTDLSFDYLMNVSAFDGLKWVENGDFIEVTYQFYSYRHRHSLTVKTRTPRAGGVVKSIVSLYGTADFQEREVFDHFGVKFEGHPNLKRILLPDDWVGNPLLKDYAEQEDYNGIATTRPSML